MQFNQVTGLLASLMVNSGALVTSEVEVEIGKTTLVVPELQPRPLSFLGNKTPTEICRSFYH